MKIITTNWINILGVFIVTLFYSVIANNIDKNLNYNILQSIVAGLILVCLYGIMFWVLFITLLIIADLLLIVRDPRALRIKLLIQWGVISSPFIYWTIKYGEWIFAVALVTFFITQILREGLIIKVTQN
jgi:hypothetical protein